MAVLSPCIVSLSSQAKTSCKDSLDVPNDHSKQKGQRHENLHFFSFVLACNRTSCIQFSIRFCPENHHIRPSRRISHHSDRHFAIRSSRWLLWRPECHGGARVYTEAQWHIYIVRRSELDIHLAH